MFVLAHMIYQDLYMQEGVFMSQKHMREKGAFHPSDLKPKK